MGKTSLGMVANFWPDGVDRYIATPGLVVHELALARPAKRSPAAPAVGNGVALLSYQQLDERAAKAAGILSALLKEGAWLVLSVSDPCDMAPLLFGALRSGHPVALAPPGRTSPADLLSPLGRSSASLIISQAEDAGYLERLVGSGVKILTLDKVWQQPTAVLPKKAARLGDTVVELMEKGMGAARHTHRTLATMAVSVSGFMQLEEGDRIVSLLPPSTWEGLATLLAALQKGALWLYGSPETEGGQQILGNGHRSHVLLRYDQAQAITQRWDTGATPWRSPRSVTISVDGPFRPSLRRSIAIAVQCPALTLYGSPRTGPVLAAHAQWHPDHAVGVPLTNVDLWPLHPKTHDPLGVPWESIQYGEIGVKSPMVGEVPPNGAKPATSGWAPTGRVAMMDAVGLFYFLS